MFRLALLATVALTAVPSLAKSEDPSHYLMHKFRGGERVVFRTGGNGLQGVYYVGQDDRAILIDPRHPYFMGQPEGAREATVTITKASDMATAHWKLQGLKGLAYAIMGGDILLINEKGQHRRFSLLPAGTPNFQEMNILDCMVYDFDGRKHLYIGYSVNTYDKATGILIDEEFRYAKKEVSRAEGANGSLIVEELKSAMPVLADGVYSAESLYTDADLSKAYLKRESADPEYVTLAHAQGLSGQHKPLVDVEVLNNEGKTVSAVEFLKTFSVNLTEKYKSAPFGGVHVNERKILEMAEVLAGYEITSVAYLGYPGTGKTTDINMMISEAANGRGPEFLREYTFIKLEPGAMDAQMWRGSTEAKITALKALARKNKVIFVIDEFHRIKGMASHRDRPHDVTEDLKDDMAEGVLKIIGMSTDSEFHGAGFSKPFQERFILVNKDEPTGAELIAMLRGWILSRHLQNPGDAFLHEANRIAERFAGIGAQPRKTTKLLDAVYARLKLTGQEGQTPDIGLLHDVARQRLGFDPVLIDTKLARQRLEQMIRYMDSRIIGQTEARALLERATIRALSNLNSGQGPRMKILLTGEEGQGKTTISKAYAQGMGLPFHIIDMSKYRHGAPVGAGPLTEAAEAIARNAFTVLIFDKMERSAIEIQEQLLESLESGRALVQKHTNGGLNSELVDFRNASVIFNVNISADEIRRGNRSAGFVSFGKRKDREILQNGQISRNVLDQVPDQALVEALSREDFRSAVALHVEDLLKEFKSKDLQVNFPDREVFLDFAASLWRENISNRRIHDILQQIRDYLAQEKVLAQNSPASDTVELRFDGRNLRLSGSDSAYSCEDLLF